MDLNFEHVCRICLNCDPNGMKNIFSTLISSNETQIHEFISKITEIKFLKDDMLPKQICSRCSNAVSSIYDFIQLCLKSDFKLRQEETKAIFCKIEKEALKDEEDYDDIPLAYAHYSDREDDEPIETKTVAKIALALDNKFNEVTNQADEDEEIIIKKREKFKCDVCHESFRIKLSFKKHMKTHGDYLDDISDREFKPSSAKEKKTRGKIGKHRDDKYNCEKCSEVFRRKLNYTNHMKIHTMEEDEDFSDGGENTNPTEEKQTQEEKQTEEENSLSKENGILARDIMPPKPDKYKCGKCPETFKRKIYYKKHMLFHDDPDRPVECKVCYETFKKQRALNIHMRIHTKKKFKCKTCSARFLFKYLLDQHYLTHLNNEEKPFHCTICNQGCVTPVTLARHMKTHEKQPKIEQLEFKCSLCIKSYKSKNSLELHMTSHTDERPYLCSICGKGFKCRQHLRSHLKSHQNFDPVFCPICNNQYKNKTLLNAHMIKHTNDRPVCDICGKFASDMKSHMFQHQGIRPYKCKTCGKGFTSSSLVRKHETTHSTERNFACEVCGMKFIRKDVLNVHKKIHTGIKPYLCDYCGKAFINISDRASHMRGHTDEKPYVCDICNAAFRQRRSLREHKLKIHNMEIPLREKLVLFKN